MSETATTRVTLPATREPVRVAVRRMRWFRAALHGYLDRLGDDLGCRYDLDDRKLASVFVRWLRAVEEQKPADPQARKPFFHFAAGLMLREMVADMPIRAVSRPAKGEGNPAAAFWPEGYACTMFCLAVTSAALAQEFDEQTTVAPAIDDLRHWWSFRENAGENPGISVAFLEMLLGHEPDWLLPDLFATRLQRELAATASPRLTS